MAIPTFDEYLASLGRLSAKTDPMAVTKETVAIKDAAESLQALDEITIESLVAWVQEHARDVPVLGLAVGLTQERLKTTLNDHLGSAGWITLARTRADELIDMFEQEYDIVRQLTMQREKSYDFGDVLVGRAGTRVIATAAGKQGREVEDAIEQVITSLGLTFDARTRFVGRGGKDAPADFVIPNAEDPHIVIAAKGFDSTGSKLTAAVTEVAEVALVRQPRQFVVAVADGIGWKMRKADLGRLHKMWVDREIDGLYTLATLEQLREDLRDFAVRSGLLKP